MAVSQSLTLTQISQNVAANTSQVRVVWRSVQSGGSFNNYQKKAKWWLRVNGGGWMEYAVYYTLPSNTDQTIVDTVVTVSHDQNGKCKVDAYTEMDTGISAGVVIQEKSLTLTDIPRYSTIAATDAPIEGVCTISITKADKNFRHSLRYSLTGSAPWTYLDATGAPADREVIFTETALSFPVPYSFYFAIPGKTKGQCTLELWTYLPDGTYLTQPQQAVFTFQADREKAAPQIAFTLQDINPATLALTGDPETLVRYMSHGQLHIEGDFCPGAYMDRAAVLYMDKWYYGTEHLFTGVATNYFKLWMQDSRGFETYAEHTRETFIPYIMLTNQTTAKRQSPTGSLVDLTITGGYFDGSFGAADNHLQVRYKIADYEHQLEDAPWQTLTPTVENGTFRAQITLEDIPYTKSCYVQTQVADALNNVSQTVKIGKGLPVFDWGEEDFRFHVPVIFTASDGTAFSLDLTDGQLTVTRR